MNSDPCTAERHDDLEHLATTINQAKTAFLTWLIPLIGLGVITLIANHFEQKRMSAEIVHLNDQITAMNRKFELMSEKVSVMWFGGDWDRSPYKLNNEKQ